MTDQPIADGVYKVKGPGGLLTMSDGLPGVAMLAPEGGAAQLWTVASESDGYTLHNASSQRYLGGDGDPNAPQMIVRGTEQPFTWNLSTGEDHDETTYVLTSAASSDGLVLSMSLLRIFPPLVAILPPATYRTVEWAFDPV